MQIGCFPDGALGEIFLDAAKQNSGLDAFAADAAILVSLLLQHGATPAEIGHALRCPPDGTAASLIGAVVDRLAEWAASIQFRPAGDFNSMEPVALRLLGEPAQKHGHEWRYGNRGSLSIDVAKGRWFDHEANIGGGVFDLIKRQGPAWLRREGLLATPQPQPRIVKTYPYCDEAGTLLFQVVRLEPKDFRQRRPDGQGGWIWNLHDTRRVPYLLPVLVKAVAAGETIFVPEGRRTLTPPGHGFAATTNPVAANGSASIPNACVAPMSWFYRQSPRGSRTRIK
jgi:hypothetical protein